MAELAQEFQTLLEKRELATVGLVGVVIHAIGNLNLNDHPAALRTLMLGLEKYMDAQNAVDLFSLDLRKEIQSEKENQSHGNASDLKSAA